MEESNAFRLGMMVAVPAPERCENWRESPPEVSVDVRHYTLVKREGTGRTWSPGQTDENEAERELTRRNPDR